MRGVTIIRSAMLAASLGIILYMYFLLRAGRRHRLELQAIQPKTPDQSADRRPEQREDHTGK
jgi:sensor domain CHASE-containing protein